MKSPITIGRLWITIYVKITAPHLKPKAVTYNRRRLAISSAFLLILIYSIWFLKIQQLLEICIHHVQTDPSFEIMEARTVCASIKSKPSNRKSVNWNAWWMEALNRQYGLHMQIIYMMIPACFQIIVTASGFEGASAIILLWSDRNPTSPGRKHSGYCGQQLVLKARELGLNYLLGGIDLRQKRCVCFWAAKRKRFVWNFSRLWQDQGVPHKVQQADWKLCNYSENLPDWFLQGHAGGHAAFRLRPISKNFGLNCWRTAT